MYCTICGTQLHPNDRQCRNCGALISQQRCRYCGGGLVPGESFCRSCGAPIVQNPTQPPPVAAKPPARSNRRRGCLFCGCLTVILLILAVVLPISFVASIYYQVPERLGLSEPAAERLLTEPPNRQAAAMIEQDLQNSGMNTEGMLLYVLPIEDQPYDVAYVLLDASAGFNFSHSNENDPVTDYLIRLAASEGSQQYNIGRIAVDYRDEMGNQILSITAPTQSINEFANGTISREAFLASIEGDIDL